MPKRRPLVSSGYVVVVVLCVAYAVSCWLARPLGPITAPDSAGYLAFAPIHALGYPLFLKLFGEHGAVVAQPIIFCLALAWLGLESLRVTSSVVLAAAVIIALLTTPDLTTYHYSLLTESLFISGTVAWLAATIRFADEPSLRAAALGAAIVAVTATVRRTGIALIPIPAVMVVMCWRRLSGNRWSVLAAAVVPALALLATERIAAGMVHGDQLTSITGRQLFAKAALLDAPPLERRSTDPLRGRLEDHLDLDFAPIRALIARAPPELQDVLTLFYETCLQWPCVAELQGPVAASSVPLNDALRQVALDRIVRARRGFATLTATHYRSLWTTYKLRHPAVAPALTAFVTANRPLPFERETFKTGPDDSLAFSASTMVKYLQPAVMLIGWITGAFAVLGLGAAATRRVVSPALTIACIASLTAHAGLMFSSLFAAGISRFVVSLWPAIMTAVVFASWVILRSLGDLIDRSNWLPPVNRWR